MNHGSADPVKCLCCDGLWSWSTSYYITRRTNPGPKSLEYFNPNTYKNTNTFYPLCGEMFSLVLMSQPFTAHC